VIKGETTVAEIDVIKDGVLKSIQTIDVVKGETTGIEVDEL